jgi:biotin-(acetyl-CoA carboxylase) ligase
MQADAPLFPPLLNGVAVEAGNDTAAAALDAVAAGNAGAGDLFWSQSEDRLNMAVVLEPDVALPKAAQMLHVLAVAFGDAFGAIAPPEIAVHYRWPGDILVNGAKAGSVRLIMPQGTSAESVPQWMVLSLDVAVTLDLSVENPGEMPDSTTLHEEGAGEVTSLGLIGSVSRHFLTWVDTWTHDGFKDVHENWWGRAAGIDKNITINHCGEVFTGRATGMDEDGNLLFRENNADAVRALALLDVIERSAA